MCDTVFAGGLGQRSFTVFGFDALLGHRTAVDDRGSSPDLTNPTIIRDLMGPIELYSSSLVGFVRLVKEIVFTASTVLNLQVRHHRCIIGQ